MRKIELFLGPGWWKNLEKGHLVDRDGGENWPLFGGFDIRGNINETICPLG